MRYLALIYSNESAAVTMTPDQQGEVFQAWLTYSNELGAAGKALGGEPLQPSTTATTVRQGSNGTIISDGPFAETKEQLGGYFIFNADDLDDAIAWAEKMPHLPHGGSVEIRPIMELG